MDKSKTRILHLTTAISSEPQSLVICIVLLGVGIPPIPIDVGLAQTLHHLIIHDRSNLGVHTCFLVLNPRIQLFKVVY